MVRLNRVRLSFPLILILGSSVAEKKKLWVEELPEDEFFWGIRMLSEDASMSMLDCEIDASVACLSESPGFGDELFDCNSVVPDDDCVQTINYIYAIENTGLVDTEIKTVTVERDGSTTTTIDTQPTLPGDTTRLIEDKVFDINLCETQPVATKAIVELGEPEPCEEDATYTLNAPSPTTHPPTTPPPTQYSYEMDTYRYPQCLEPDCDVDFLCGFSGVAADAEFQTQDWLKVTRGLKAQCSARNWYLLEGVSCTPDENCGGRCHIELTCLFDEE